MRRPDMNPKLTRILRFAATTRPIIADAFEMRRPDASPKMMIILRFMTTSRPMIADILEMRRQTRRESKNDDNSAFRDHAPPNPWVS